MTKGSLIYAQFNIYVDFSPGKIVVVLSQTQRDEQPNKGKKQWTRVMSQINNFLKNKDKCENMDLNLSLEVHNSGILEREQHKHLQF